MVVGICQLTFHLPGNRSLKGKRQIVRRLCERIRSRFHVSIGEVDEIERHQQASLGIALVGNDTRKLRSVLEQILQSIDLMQLVHLVDQQVEFLQYNSTFGSDRPLLDPEAVKRDDDYDDYDDYADDGNGEAYDSSSDNLDAYLDASKDATAAGAPETDQPLDGTPSSQRTKKNPWAYLDEWED